MKHSFPYRWAEPLDLGGCDLNGIYAPAALNRAPAALDRSRDTGSRKRGPSLAEALERPMGTPGLKDLVRQKTVSGVPRVLVIADDMTRNTPMKLLLPKVMEQIRAGGVPSENIRILIGNGLHRTMSPGEIAEHFGKQIARSCGIANHDALDESNLLSVGKASDGTPIKVNRSAVESDFVLAVGQIAPHRVAGFSGGSKMIQPGICGKDVTESVHWRGWLAGIESIFGRRDNPVREEMDGIARKVGLDFIVNVVLNPDDSIYGVYAGDFIAAHREGCKAALEIYSASVKKADIVVIDSYPSDIDLWQAAKAASPAELVMKPGGSVILVTPCPEGVSPNHPEIQSTGYMPMAEILRKVETGVLTSRLVACHLIALGRILESGRLILVSPGFQREEALAMGLDYARTANEALRREIDRLGSGASVSVLTCGGKIFPLVNH